MCPNYEPEGQGRGSSFRVCHALGRLASLLHTEGFVDSQMATIVFQYRSCQVFSKEDENESSSSYKKIRRTNSLRTGARLGVISDIHRVATNLEVHVDVRNIPQ